MEVDEVFIGNIKAKGLSQRAYRRHKNKIPSFVDRETGLARSIVVDDLRVSTILPILKENIVAKAHVMTDEAKHYNQAKKHFAEHDTAQPSGSHWHQGPATCCKRTCRGLWQVPDLRRTETRPLNPCSSPGLISYRYTVYFTPE